MTEQVGVPGKIYELNTPPYVALFDGDAEIYEIFMDKDCEAYIGNADTLADANQVALNHYREDRAERNLPCRY